MVNTVIDSAIVGQTVWATDLSEVQGLETLVHSGPSEIGQQALSLARGQLPDEFLKRCGLSDWQLLNARLYDPTLSAEAISDLQYRVFDLRVGQPLQVSSLFISYSHADSRFVTKLERVLDSQGIRYWRDVHHATAGRLDKVVERAIRLQDVTLLVLSESSVESDWVQHEVRVARAREKEEKRDLLCPIALDESWKSADWDPVIMDQVKRYNILSFQDWEDDVGFRDTYERLKAGWSIFY
ncbi:MAG: toll/interleukin-1 receptor domain-containing protein [Planctomycetota bacterium]